MFLCAEITLLLYAIWPEITTLITKLYMFYGAEITLLCCLVIDTMNEGHQRKKINQPNK